MGYQLRAGPLPPPPFCSASLTFVFLCWRSATLTAADLGDQFMSLPEMSHTNGSHLHRQNTWHYLTTSIPQEISLSHFFFSPRLLKHWLHHHRVTDRAIQGCFLVLVSPGSRAGPSPPQLQKRPSTSAQQWSQTAQSNLRHNHTLQCRQQLIPSHQVIFAALSFSVSMSSSPWERIHASLPVLRAQRFRPTTQD